MNVMSASPKGANDSHGAAASAVQRVSRPVLSHGPLPRGTGPKRAAERPRSYVSTLCGSGSDQNGQTNGVVSAVFPTVAFEHVTTEEGIVGKYTVPAGVILVVITGVGSAQISASRSITGIGSGQAGVIARPGRVDVAWSAGSHGYVLKLDRRETQAKLFWGRGEPRRIRQVVTAVAWSTTRAESALARLLMTGSTEDVNTLSGLIGHLLTQGDEPLSSVAPAISAAIAAIRAQPAGPHDLASLAMAAAAKPSSFRRELSDLLGISPTRLISDCRIVMAGDLLRSCRETRSVDQVARALGFQSSATFARAFARHFDRSPAKFRAEAIRSSECSNPS